jgi:hypothetical protein
VAFAGPVRVAEIVGAVRSITMVFADAIALGPVVVVPVTEFAFICKCRKYMKEIEHVFARCMIDICHERKMIEE